MGSLSSYERMEMYLQERYTSKHNTVLNKIELTNRETGLPEYLDDYKLNSLVGELLRKKIGVSKSVLVDALRSDLSPQFNPFEEYFASVGLWTPEEPDYIQQLADTVTVPEADRPTWNKYLRRWLISTVGCATIAEITNQTVLVFVGEQGIGKTKWTEKLVPDALQDYYYAGEVNPGDKDSSINLAECFLINLDELGNLNRGDLNSLKQLITQSSVRIRRPYGTLHEKMPRRASFIGSVNNPEFLRDDTGNRRYLCVDAQSINHAHTVNIDKVYAQANYLLNNAEKYWFDGDEIVEINSYNQRYRVQYLELEYVNELFMPCSKDENADIELTITELQRYIKDHGENILNVNNRQLGIALKASEYVRTKRNGTWYYKLKNKPKQKAEQKKA